MKKRHLQPNIENYYISEKECPRHSAKEVIHLILELLQPKQVIDIGCNTGTWLSVFKECGVEDIWGIDGDWIDKKKLQIPEDRFLSFDLTKPFRVDRQFDLVVSLEVAEHLPSECAKTFIDSLVKLGPVILFSAAIPFQGGTHHINEQWPDYWVKHFQEKEYVVIDCIRKKIWQNANVLWWYAQNILMFVRQDYLESHPLLKREFENTVISSLSIVHPKQYLEAVKKARESSDPRNIPLKSVLSTLPILMKNALKRRIKRGLFNK